MTKIDNFVLIIGAMKSGTTSLYNYLIQHPEIAACHTKEPGFFNLYSRFIKGMDFYQSLWDWNANIHKYALEATPGYTRVTYSKYLNAAEKIESVSRLTGANFKFIYILRNPLDRIESHYTQGLKHRDLDAIKSGNDKIDREIIETSKYAMQIEEYYRRFPAEKILLLKLEDLENNSDDTISGICQFLGIDDRHEFQKLDLAHNAYSHETSRVLIPGYSWLRKTEFVKNNIKFMSKDLKQKTRFIRNLLARKVTYQYLKLSPVQKAYVLEELKPDLRQLRDKYRVDIDSWGIEV